ncbi:MAG TPA: hypothetical protein VH351_14290 [Bryobacteraceae bacterium]|jgi:hypothetical protein|nr:hypothetical protein [Bryobacteraceae bacterium]
MSSSSVSSIDEIIELYKRDVDVTLMDECLKRTVEERILALEAFERFRCELQSAVTAHRDSIKKAAGRPKDFEALAELESIRDRSTSRDK